jgi:hypothetical protein
MKYTIYLPRYDLYYAGDGFQHRWTHLEKIATKFDSENKANENIDLISTKEKMFFDFRKLGTIAKIVEDKWIQKEFEWD